MDSPAQRHMQRTVTALGYRRVTRLPWISLATLDAI